MSAASNGFPSGEPKSHLKFSSFILDLDACSLARVSGEVVALTRSEFALLRFLAQRPGRVASRETLLDAIANRRFAPFDRSIDVVVGRLRRKIEQNPRCPRIIVTVAGEGYRFDGLALSCAPPASAGSVSDSVFVDASSGFLAPPECPKSSIRFEALSGRRVFFAFGALCFVLLLTLVGFLGRSPGTKPVAAAPPKMVVLPFANFTGDGSKDYLGRALAVEVTTFLGADPGLRVVSASAPPRDPIPNVVEAARAADAQYIVQGGVHQLRDTLRITATLYDGATGTALWSRVFDLAENETLALKEDISRQIYDAIAGFRGKIYANEERISWGKSSAGLEEYDYFLRGLSSYLRFTPPDELEARAIFQQGCDRYPDSALLRLAQAWTYLWMAMNQLGQDPRPDIDQAWRFANEALSVRPLSPLEDWLAHWLMAFLYQWHDNDFSRSVAEARAAVEKAPYDAYSRNDLSWILANAGYGGEAVAWARSGLDHDPNGPSRYHANLAWAYYVAGRDQEGVDALADRRAEFPLLYAALLVRLGQVDKAKALIEGHTYSGARDTVEKQDVIPLVEPAGTEYLALLRTAGLPEK